MYDIGSTHGTILNGGAPIAPNLYKRIMAGDSIKFGASSRTWVFEGGPDRQEALEDNPAAQKVVATASAKPTTEPSPSAEKVERKAVGNVVVQAKKKFNQAKKDDVKSKGDEDDAETRLETQLNKKSNRHNGDEDVEEEGGVSDEERDNADMEMVAEFLGREAIEGADGEDSFYDRTLGSGNGDRKANAKQNTQQQRAENFETLTAKLRVLNYVISVVNERIQALNKIISKDESRRDGTGNGDGEVDALDAFMSGMSQTVEEEEEKEKKAKLLQELEKEKQDMQHLSERLKPSTAQELSLSIVSASELETIGDLYYNELSQRVTQAGGNTKLQMKKIVPEPKRAKLSEVPISVPHISMPPPSIISNSPDSSIPNPPMQTKEHVDDVSRKSAPPFPEPQPMAPPNPKKRERSKQVYDDEGEAEDAYASTWRAPEGQSGDGRTSLNDKFGY